VNDAVLALYDAVAGLVENLVYLPVVDSTHDSAIRLIQQVDEEDQRLRPTLLIAGRQTAGRGRSGNTWLSPEGGLYLNWVRSDIDEGVVNALPMLAAAAASEALATAGIASVRIKWPNDLLVEGAKIGGVLIHVRRGETILATIGLGLNVVTKPKLNNNLKGPATCLAEHVTVPPTDSLFPELAAAFLAGLEHGIQNPLLARAVWLRRLVHRPGDAIEVHLASGEELRGRYAGVTVDGHLMLDSGTQTHTISSGEIIER
jgi:BirA family transcriptional regulator, biotin operon repressor / biotin---[acetyl-CoA-carboxylase] ligase